MTVNKKTTSNKKANNQAGVFHLVILVTSLVAVIALLITGHFVLNRNTITPLRFIPQQPPSGIVEISDKGFNPSTISIKQGQSILFINNQDWGVHIVASAPYPSHATLPSFISPKLIGKSSYSVTFRQKGTFNYQDDLNPYTFKGTVVIN